MEKRGFDKTKRRPPRGEQGTPSIGLKASEVKGQRTKTSQLGGRVYHGPGILDYERKKRGLKTKRGAQTEREEKEKRVAEFLLSALAVSGQRGLLAGREKAGGRGNRDGSGG